jgi:hypothetical protein
MKKFSKKSESRANGPTSQKAGIFSRFTAYTEIRRSAAKRGPFVSFTPFAYKRCFSFGD